MLERRHKMIPRRRQSRDHRSVTSRELDAPGRFPSKMKPFATSQGLHLDVDGLSDDV